MDLGLKDASVMVTGASQGIGFAIALAFAREGARLMLVARNEKSLRKLADQLTADHGTHVTIYTTDLSKHADIERLIETCGEVDVLVNNAGAIPSGDLFAIGDSEWREAWDLKVMGYIAMTRGLAKRIARRGGAIINIVGSAGETLMPGYICGSVGNAALMAFTRAFAKQYNQMGGRIVAINPGIVLTERAKIFLEQREMFADGATGATKAAKPYDRFAKPKEIADAAVFLASSRSGYTNGAVLTINGGG